MGEENNPPAPQAGAGDPINPPGQAPTTPPTDPQAGEGQKPPKSADDYERMIAELRKESAAHRTKLKKFEDEEAKRLEAQLTEQQKKDKQFADLQKAHDDALRSHQEYKVSTEVRLQAAQMGFADLSDATRLLDWSQITYDDDGTPNNVAALLKDLLKAKPYLAGKPAATPPTSGGATNPPRSQTSGQQEITDAFIAQLTPAQYSSLTPDMKLRVSQYMQSRVDQRR